MHSERRKLSADRKVSGKSTFSGKSMFWGNKPGPLGFALGLLVGLSMAVSTGCHRTAAPEERPIAVGMPAQVTQKVNNAQAAFVNSVGSLARDYDRAVCEEEGQMAQDGQSRQAMSEAQLEVDDAVSSARSQTPQRRGGGPTDVDVDADGQNVIEDSENITIIEEAPKPRRDRGGWTCMQARAEPSCVDASASYATNRVYRNYVSGIDLNPVTAGDVLEAFAADAQWAQRYLVDASDRAQAFSQIEQACRDGQSPLLQFFEAAAAFDHPQVRRDLTALRDDFTGMGNDVCAALPGYYRNLMTELQQDLSRRVRTGHCSASKWQVLWDE